MRYFALVMLLLVLPCAGLAAQGDLSAVPVELEAYMAQSRTGNTLVDYLELENTPDGDVVIVLMDNGTERILQVCKRVDGVLKTDISTVLGIPQEGENAYLYTYEAGRKMVRDWDGSTWTSDGLNFGVAVPDVYEETIESSVLYAWKDGGIFLVSYRKKVGSLVDIVGDDAVFYNTSFGLEGRTKRTMATDIRLVDFEALPWALSQATGAPEIPEAQGMLALREQPVILEPGHSYEVYVGPGRMYARAGNGKAQVSTNDWVQVFGAYGDWLFVQYGISEEQCRFGWIEHAAVASGEQVAELALEDGDWYTLGEAYWLTDDPLCSRGVTERLPAGTQMELMACLGDEWAYVRVQAYGETLWGFIPFAMIGHG